MALSWVFFLEISVPLGKVPCDVKCVCSVSETLHIVESFCSLGLLSRSCHLPGAEEEKNLSLVRNLSFLCEFHPALKTSDLLQTGSVARNREVIQKETDCSDLSKIHCLKSNSVIKCSMCFIATFIWLLFKPQYVGLYIFSVPVFTEADVVCLPIDLSWNGRVKHFYYSKNNLENSWAHPFVYKIDFWCKASFITAQTGIDQPIKNRVMVSAALLETPTRIGFSV